MSRSKIILSLALLAGLSVGGIVLVPSWAADRLAAAGDGQGAWLSLGQVVGILEGAGYRNIEKIEREHGGYEGRATDRDGRRVKLEINPRTGEIARQRPDGRERERAYDDDRPGRATSSADCNKRRCRDDLPPRNGSTQPAAK
ncbi:MAG: PepSY domain-containing protein [Dechloromonas sp.]|nr:PepSY domain-containing protein [Dechloromonas sp.]